jgi:EAL domain-containing protein (putative c-di-GMP-specific phosphodiesterase class I)
LAETRGTALVAEGIETQDELRAVRVKPACEVAPA